MDSVIKQYIMNESTKENFINFCSNQNVSNRYARDAFSRLLTLEKMLNIDLENINITNEKYLEINLQINDQIKFKYSNVDSMRSTKGNFSSALRLFIKYKYGVEKSKEIIVRLKPIQYSYKK